MILGSLLVNIGARTTDFERKMGKVHRSLEDMSDTFGRIGRTMSMFVTLPLLGVGIASIKAASDVEEMRSKFSVVFGELAGDAEKWADDTGRAVNRSQFDLMGYLATLQDTFVPMGFARNEAAKFSKQLTQLGIDLASFNNTSEPETINLLTSAIVGNHEAVRRFGIVMTEATLKQELLNMGIEGGTQAATEQQKILARMNVIMRSTKDAQGDAARTAGSFANQLKGLQAAAKDAAVMIGEQLLPMVTKLVKSTREAIGHFTALDESMKGLIVSVGGLAVAFAPLLIALNWIVKNSKTLAVAFRGIAAVGALSLTGKGSRFDTGELEKMRSGDSYLDRILGRPGEIEKRTSKFRDGLGLAGGEMSRIAQATGSLISRLNAAGDAASTNLTGGIKEAGEAAGDLLERMQKLASGKSGTAGLNLTGIAEEVSELNISTGKFEKSWQKVKTAIDATGVILRTTVAPVITEVVETASASLADMGAALRFNLEEIGIAGVNGLSHAIGGAVAGFESFGKAVKRIMKAVIADIVAAIAKVLILKTLMTVFGGGTGILSSIVQAVAGAGGITSGFNLPTSPSMLSAAPSMPRQPVILLRPQLTGKLAISAGELQFMLDERDRFIKA